MQTSQNILIMVFWFDCILLIEFQIRIFDKMLLPKTSVSFEGLFYSSLIFTLNSAVVKTQKLLRSCGGLTLIFNETLLKINQNNIL